MASTTLLERIERQRQRRTTQEAPISRETADSDILAALDLWNQGLWVNALLAIIPENLKALYYDERTTRSSNDFTRMRQAVASAPGEAKYQVLSHYRDELTKRATTPFLNDVPVSSEKPTAARPFTPQDKNLSDAS